MAVVDITATEQALQKYPGSESDHFHTHLGSLNSLPAGLLLHEPPNICKRLVRCMFSWVL
jgi:hypothetical protein